MAKTTEQATSAQLLAWSNLAKTLARRAGTLILSMQHEAQTCIAPVTENLEINSKSNSTDLVTRADLASQELIFTSLRSNASTCEHRLIGEEDGDTYSPLDDEATWIVDAIDGTTNYVHGLRDFAVSIALSINKRVVLGVVHSPANNELFHSINGVGSWLNDIPMKPSGRRDLSECLVVSEWGYVRDKEGVKQMLEINERLMVRPVRGVRQLGSGSLDICYVGLGRIDAVYCGVAPKHKDGWKIWDYAASSLIATESGATMKSVDGLPFDIEGSSMVCATPGVMNELLETIQG